MKNSRQETIQNLKNSFNKLAAHHYRLITKTLDNNIIELCKIECSNLFHNLKALENLNNNLEIKEAPKTITGTEYNELVKKAYKTEGK